MSKRVLDVGQCAPDHHAVSRLLETEFDAEVEQAHTIDDALQKLDEAAFDLVLVNRVFDRDGSEGLELVRRIRQDDSLGHVPVMLVSNYPEAQESARAAGARPGFGKAELNTPMASARLREALSGEREARHADETIHEPVHVHTVRNPVAAEIIKDALAEQGIPCAIEGEHQAAFAGVLEIRLFVPAAQAEHARAFVHEHEAARGTDEEE